MDIETFKKVEGIQAKYVKKCDNSIATMPREVLDDVIGLAGIICKMQDEINTEKASKKRLTLFNCGFCGENNRIESIKNYQDGNVFFDHATELEWCFGEDRDTSRVDAVKHVQALGHDWRMPKIDELRHLKRSSFHKNVRTCQYVVWSDSAKDGMGRVFDFSCNQDDCYGVNEMFGFRSLAVRHRPMTELEKRDNLMEAQRQKIDKLKTYIYRDEDSVKYRQIRIDGYKKELERESDKFKELINGEHK